MSEKPARETTNGPEETPAAEPRAEEKAAAADAAEDAPEDLAGDEAAAPPAEIDPVAELTAEKEQLHERWLRAVAEMDNVRKRTRREVQDARRFARVDVLRAMLAVADDFDRALRSLDDGTDDGADDADGGMRAGVELIHQRFLSALREQGVETVEALGQEFDPARHEAVGQAERADTPAGIVIEVVQTGYRLDDFILRPARVIVSR